MKLRFLIDKLFFLLSFFLGLLLLYLNQLGFPLLQLFVLFFKVQFLLLLLLEFYPVWILATLRNLRKWSLQLTYLFGRHRSQRPAVGVRPYRDLALLLILRQRALGIHIQKLVVDLIVKLLGLSGSWVQIQLAAMLLSMG